MTKGRPPLALGAWGKFWRFERQGRPAARVRIRDLDGVVRTVVRTGRTHAEAERHLVEAIRERIDPSVEELTRDSRLSKLIAAWLEEIRRDDKAPRTVALYTATVENHVSPLGELRVHEFTAPRMQRLVNSVADASGPGATRTLLVVLKGMCALAVRHGAMPENPVASLKSPPRKKVVVRAPTMEELHLLQQLLRKHDARDTWRGPAVRDIADIGTLLIGTGVNAELEWTP